jgi:hypothetical protein
MAPGHTAAEGETWLALVHVEIESRDSVEPLRHGMFDAYKQLRTRHDLPVLPVALYLRVGLDGVGWDTYEEGFGGNWLIRFRFAYVGLPGLEAEMYVAGENVLGAALSVLMRVPAERRAELAAQALQRVATSGENEYRRHLLAECTLAYSGLGEDQRRELNRVLAQESYQEARGMATNMLDEIRQEGMEKGMEKGQRQILLMQLERRFGPLTPEVRQRLEGLTLEQVQTTLLNLLTAGSLKELGLEG